MNHERAARQEPERQDGHRIASTEVLCAEAVGVDYVRPLARDDAGKLYEWRCIHADQDAGCPRKRPRIGAECVRPLSCDYGTCVFEDGVVMDCYSGYWAKATTGSSGCR